MIISHTIFKKYGTKIVYFLIKSNKSTKSVIFLNVALFKISMVKDRGDKRDGWVGRCIVLVAR